jgi:hypothetical protein
LLRPGGGDPFDLVTLAVELNERDERRRGRYSVKAVRLNLRAPFELREELGRTLPAALRSVAVLNERRFELRDPRRQRREPFGLGAG